MAGLALMRTSSVRRRRQRGFSLLELLAALALGAILASGLASMVKRSMDDLREQQTAAYHERFNAAAADYLRANQALLLTQAASAPVALGVAQLSAAGAAYLAPGFAVTNPYGQTPCLLVRSAGGVLSALAVSEGGEAIGAASLAHIAAQAGRGAGAIGLAAGATAPAADGAFGGWRLDAAALAAYTQARCSASAASAGHLASALFADSADQLPGDFLYRDQVPGRPEVNQMNTPLRMGGTGLVATGTACDGRAQVAIDSNRNIVSCGLDKQWKSSASNTWRDPVASYAALTALSGEPEGAVRVTLDTSRAFVRSGNAWKALAVDQNGNLLVEDKISAYRGAITTDLTVGRDINVSNDLNVGNDVNVQAGVYAESLQASGWVVSTSYEFAYIGGGWGEYAAPGQACHISLPRLPSGEIPIMYPIATQIPDKNGVTLICHGPERIFLYQNGKMTP
jgi:prepilin-type N-terminal cleavage/methylation domain-containing protein